VYNFNMLDHEETPAQKYKELLEQAEQLKTKSVESLKANIEYQIRELNEYGFSYELTVQRKPKAAKAKACKVCGATDHDGRFHRNKKATSKKAAA
jgi:hypothetical protein